MENTCDLMDCPNRATVTIDVQNFGDLYWIRHRACDEHADEFAAEFKRTYSDVVERN